MPLAAACPVPFTLTGLPRVDPLLVNVTVPVVTADPEEVTVAVKVTELPGEALKEGLLFDERLVLVGVVTVLLVNST